MPASGTKITLSAAEPVYGIYLVWDKPPEPWQLSYGTCKETHGENGFLHEYIALSEPADALTLQTGTSPSLLCDVYLFRNGDLPDWVQLWQPPYPRADLLLIPTHADDEHIFFGGTMPYYAGESGLKVQVAYLTNHWGEPYRPHELLNGLWKVGITHYPVISEFEDIKPPTLEDAKKHYGVENITAYITELLRRFKPLVVIGHDVNGEYGHSVHKLNAFCLQRAVNYSANPYRYPESVQRYGTWDVPKTYLHLYGENPIVMDWSIPLAAFGGKTALEAAKEGFNAHTSQLKYFEVRADGKYDCRKFGLYRSLVGKDIAGNDFTENLKIYPESEVTEAQTQPATVPESTLAPESSFAPEPTTALQAHNEESPAKRGGAYAIIFCGAAFTAAAVLINAARKKRKKNK